MDQECLKQFCVLCILTWLLVLLLKHIKNSYLIGKSKHSRLVAKKKTTQNKTTTTTKNPHLPDIIKQSLHQCLQIIEYHIMDIIYQ